MLAELARVISGGGTLVFNYSNKRNLSRIVRLGYLGAATARSPWRPSASCRRSTVITRRSSRSGCAPSTSRTSVNRGAGAVDKLAPRLGGLGDRVPPGVALARPLGAVKLGPLVFASARAPGGPLAPSEHLR